MRCYSSSRFNILREQELWFIKVLALWYLRHHYLCVLLLAGEGVKRFARSALACFLLFRDDALRNRAKLTQNQKNNTQNKIDLCYYFSPVCYFLFVCIEFVSITSAMAENQSQTTTSNTPSEPVLCKLGCGFFVSILIFIRTR